MSSPLPTTRKEIRKGVLDLLLGKTVAEDRVFANRTPPISQRDELPVILIYPEGEEDTVLQHYGTQSKLKRKDLSLIVEIIVEETSERLLNDAIDDLADQVEDLIEKSDKIGNLVHDISIDTSEGEYSVDGDLSWATWKMNFKVSYIKKF